MNKKITLNTERKEALEDLKTVLFIQIDEIRDNHDNWDEELLIDSIYKISLALASGVGAYSTNYKTSASPHCISHSGEATPQCDEPEFMRVLKLLKPALITEPGTIHLQVAFVSPGFYTKMR